MSILEEFVADENRLISIAKHYKIDHLYMCRHYGDLPEIHKELVKQIMIKQVKRLEEMKTKQNVISLPLSRRYK